MAEPMLYARSWDVDDVEILRSKDGHSDGRTVTAYAAVFNKTAEIYDQHGHYMERIDPKAFNRQLGLGIQQVHVLYNHGLTAHGTPASGPGSVPIGSPVEITADSRGLRTVTRFNRSDTADHVLEAIRNGDIRGYSFRGKIYKSNPERVPRVSRPGAGLPTITRTELGLAEYGPVCTPAYADAGILAIRSTIDTLINGGLTRDEVLRIIASTTPHADEDQETPNATSTPEPGDATDQPTTGGHSRRDQQLLRIKAMLRDRGIA